MALSLFSCSREDVAMVENQGREIVLDVKASSTRADAEAVQSVPSRLFIAMTSGEAGQNETSVLAPVSKDVDAGKIATGKFQTSNPVPYNYYASNVGMTFSERGCTVAATNDTDVIVGITPASSSLSPSIHLGHVFARVSGFEVSAPAGFSVSGASARLREIDGTSVTGMAGTYNIATGSWVSSTSRLSTARAIEPDQYYIPGTYEISYSFTLSKDDWSQSYTKTGKVTLGQGKVNRIVAYFNSEIPEPVNIGVSLTDWADDVATVF